jgi:hypothetical protein
VFTEIKSKFECQIKKTGINSFLIPCIILFFSLLSLWPIFIKDGWPFNHEWLSWRSRLICYVLHFKQGDIFPIWSSGDTYGMGSPLPLYYHKLFYFLSALLYLLVNNVKGSIVISLVIFNFIGVYGVYKSLRLLNIEKYIALFIGLTLLFQYYTITDWFIRGAFAEYSALMLLPWLFYWAFNLLLYSRYSVWLGVLFGVLYHAHSMIAYYAVFLIIATQIIGIIYKKVVLKKLFFLNLKIACLVILIIGFYNFPIIFTSKYYDPSYIKFDMNDQFRNILEYFINLKYHWTETWEGYTVEFNPMTIIFSLILVLILLFDKKNIIYLLKSNPVYTLLLFVFVFYSALQFRFSILFYNNIPGADFLQFPWRLISFMQLSLLFLLGIIFNYLRKYPKLKHLSFVFFLCLVVTYPIFNKTSDGWQWFNTEQLEAQTNDGVFGIGEYMPVVKGFDKPDADFFKKTAVRGIQIKDSTSIVTALPYSNKEELFLNYNIKMVNKDTLILPFNYSGLELIYITKDGVKYFLPSYRTDDDPRIKANLPIGAYDLTLVLPNMGNFIRKLKLKNINSFKG